MRIGPVGPDLEKDSYCGQHSSAAEEAAPHEESRVDLSRFACFQ